MSLTVILLISSTGDDDHSWLLTPEQETEFYARLGATPVPAVTASTGGHQQGYAGLMVRSGGGDTWTIFQNWITGGLNTHFDDGRALEQWLLDTGKEAIKSQVAASLIERMRPRG